MKSIFEQIISKHYWQDAICGTGSTIANTEMLREQLPNFLKRHNIKSMFDAPCGDYSWMKLVTFPDNFTYIGGDIVSQLIEQNQQNYPEVNFQLVDISQDKLPDVDLFFCRDCLIHFSQQDIKRTLENIARSNIKYVLFTNHPTVLTNPNITTGQYHSINFLQAPFNFEEPIDVIEDRHREHLQKEEAPKNMSLWSVEQVRKYVLYEY